MNISDVVGVMPIPKYKLVLPGDLALLQHQAPDLVDTELADAVQQSPSLMMTSLSLSLSLSLQTRA